MDTKLKNYRFSVGFKLLSLLLCVSGMLTLGYGLIKAPYFEYAIQNRDFKQSATLNSMMFNVFDSVAYTAFKYRDEDFIKSGGALDNESYLNHLSSAKAQELENTESDYRFQIEAYKEQLDLYTTEDVAQPTSDTNNASAVKSIQEKIEALEKEKQQRLDEIGNNYDKTLEDAKNDAINAQLSNYQNLMRTLKSKIGFYYTVVENGKVTFSNLGEDGNVENFYKALPYSLQISQNNRYSLFQNKYAYSSFQLPFPADTVVYIGISQEKYNAELDVFNQNLKEGLLGLKIFGLGLIAFLIGLINMIYSAGRRVDKEGIHLTAIDDVYLDVALVISSLAIFLCMGQVATFGRHYVNGTYINTTLVMAILIAAITIGTLVGILFITMFVKRLKRREILKNTLLFKAAKGIRNAAYSITHRISSVYDGSPAAIRLVSIFGAYALITLFCIMLLITGYSGVLMGFFGLVAVNITAVYFVLKAFKIFKNIKEGADKIRAGELNYAIPEQGIPEFKALSATINGIADGLKNAVNSQVKSERMKAELITNVSHDLKTPLTSIITYVDLLKNEGLQSENAEKYLGVIDAKSQRLKTLTEDLFEAAKANSGNIPLNLEPLNIVSLINQGLGELSDKLEASGLHFKVNLPLEKLFVYADGKLLWRVIENILSNVFKYALPGSRVYIDAISQQTNVSITIKNISAYELNIDADELMERFKRGDASRHSEGSGLGLSIARSLTELQGGIFRIEVDGDLFKSVIELPKYIE